jgi:hypothetical protein
MAGAVTKAVKRHFMLLPMLALCLLAVQPLQCATLERLSLDDMITRSTAIVRAKVGGSSAAFTGPVIYTHYSLQVSETFKGPSLAAVDVAVPGGTTGSYRQMFAGAPRLDTGGEYVFFLWTGRSGVTQIIGLTQGLFALPQAGVTDPLAVRAASHELMLDRGRPVKDQTTSMRLGELRSRIAARLGTVAQGAQK